MGGGVLLFLENYVRTVWEYYHSHNTPGPWIRALQKTLRVHFRGWVCIAFVRGSVFLCTEEKTFMGKGLDSTYSNLVSSVVITCCSCDCFLQGCM